MNTRGKARPKPRALLAARAGIVFAVALLAGGCDLPIGHSTEGREIHVHRFGEGPRVVLLVGGLHTGAEDNTRVLAEQIRDYIGAHPGVVPKSVTLLIVPSANPDGSAGGRHANARGVDLNRNWPASDWAADACHPSTGCRPGLGGEAPLSEPETAALHALITRVRPEVTVVWHAHAPLVEANEVPGAEAYGRAYAGAAGYDYVDEWTAYRITGQLIDALEERLGLRAFDVELARCCEITGDEFERNLRGVLALVHDVDRRAGNAAASPTPRPEPTRFHVPKVPDIDLP